MSPPDHHGLTLAVVGTPAVGKTTVARLIAGTVGGRYQSMADLARVARRDGWLATGQGAGTDRPDTHDDDAVLAVALHRHALTDPGSLVVLDDVVTSAASLDTFARGDRTDQVRLQVVELAAPDLLLLHRAQRPFCPFCQPDPDSEPHQPAPPIAGATPCPTCGRALSIRARDEPTIFQQRHEIHLQHRPELMTAAARHRIRWTRIEATGTPQQCADLAIAAIAAPRRRSRAGPRRPPAPREPSP